MSGDLRLILALVLLPSAGLAQSLPFATYASDDGLAESVVLSLHQDSSGYLWLGTPSGASRFDGLAFSNFDDSHGLPSPVVRAFLEDRKGTLWAGTDRGLARRAADGAWEALPLGWARAPSTAGGAAAEPGVRCLVEAEDGALWAGTFGDGIFELDDSRRSITVYTTAGSLAHNRVRACLRDRRGRLWFGTYGGGISSLVGNGFANYRAAEGP